MTLEQLVDERNNLLSALVDMVRTHCRRRDCEGYSSEFLSANAFAMRLLCGLGAMKMDHDGYGRAVATSDIPDEEAFTSSRQWRVWAEAQGGVAEHE